MQERVDDSCPPDPPARAEPATASRRTWPIWFALAFGVVPNGIALLIHRSSGSDLAWIYCHAIPVSTMSIRTVTSSEITPTVLVTILVDAMAAYLLTAFGSRWLGLRLAILAVCVLAPRVLLLFFLAIAMGQG